MTNGQNSDWRPIKLSAKVFGHISQGLYRTPAGAIKELVSNAFDADATTVKIHTGFPRFETFSCEDNGKGLSRDEFDRLMEQGIGTSLKRSDEEQETEIYHRRVIGRLGIGLLSLAQICTEFDLYSHCAEDKRAFVVTLRFPAYTKQEIDRIKARSSKDMIEGGKYKVKDIEFDSNQKGVRIFTRFLREPFRKRMSNLSRFGNHVLNESKAPYSSFDDFLAAIYKAKDIFRSLTLASDYDQLLFGLSLLPPLTYFDSNSNIMLSIPFMEEYNLRLKRNDFHLFVDNLELTRPLKLPSDQKRRSAAECKVERHTLKSLALVDGAHKEKVQVQKFYISIANADERFSAYHVKYSNQKVAGRPLAFWGYLFQQTGRVYPRDIQGVIVRIRDVAIGTYDNSLMTYPYGEGPRYSMVSGEFIVEQGFEDALNIDRDSFNSLDPHYLRMQAYLHALLHDIIFPETWGEEKSRNKERRDVAKEERRKTFVRFLRDQSGGKFTRIRRLELEDSETKDPVKFSPTKKAVILNVNHPLLREVLRRHKYEELVEQITIAFEKAHLESSADKQREVFYAFLSKIFGSQP